MIDLAKRAVACPRWRWIRGMRVIVETKHGTLMLMRVPEQTWPGEHWLSAPGDLPDFNDAATVGCLAALVREVLQKPHLFAGFYLDDAWSICDHHEHLSGFRSSEAEAWIEALEAAP